MSPPRDVTMAARVPLDLRAEAEELVTKVRNAGAPGIGRDPEFDLSHVIRLGVRRLVDEELHARPRPGRLFNPREGSSRRHDRPTSKAAALDVAPRAGSQRRRALEVIVGRGDRGATTDEVIEVLEASHRVAVNGVARRVTDLLQAGAIEPLLAVLGSSGWQAHTADHRIARPPRAGEGTVPGGAEVTRVTRHGSRAIVYVATAKGRQWLEASERSAAA
jgi:hypothetical protein